MKFWDKRKNYPNSCCAGKLIFTRLWWAGQAKLHLDQALTYLLTVLNRALVERVGAAEVLSRLLELNHQR